MPCDTIQAPMSSPATVNLGALTLPFPPPVVPPPPGRRLRVVN